jgi:hypothetical protein
MKKKKTTPQKTAKAKWAGSMTQVIELLPSKLEAQSSTSSTKKKKKTYKISKHA